MQLTPSSVTLNLNLNLPGEEFSGPGVRFFDRKTRQVPSLEAPYSNIDAIERWTVPTAPKDGFAAF
ncbi:hypothetical protein [Loktanella sp. R86503]|uniref:hypothetical protein n=1 Tax=Loktanella sp. R86503 TaxID=3093847 RepID=UPI0036D7BF4D